MTVVIGQSYNLSNLNAPVYTGNSQGWTVITPSGSWKNGYGGVYPGSGTSLVVYVADAAHGGSDSNDGSSAHPFATPTHAASVIRNNQPDWVLLQKGNTWTDQLPRPQTSGLNRDNPTVWASYSPTGID